MMSAIDTRDEISKCLASGADSYLIKPLRMQELKLLWQHVLNKKKETMFRAQVAEHLNSNAPSAKTTKSELIQPVFLLNYLFFK